jgi:zeaxanthin epoxidase
MHSVTPIILLAFMAHALAKGLSANRITGVEDSLDKLIDQLVDKLFDQAHKMLPLHNADLDDTNLVHPAMSVRPRSLFPTSRRPLPGGQLRSMPNVVANGLSKLKMVNQLPQFAVAQSAAPWGKWAAPAGGGGGGPRNPSCYVASVGVPEQIGTYSPIPDEVTKENPLRVIIAGAGIGGLALANSLQKHEHMNVTVLERTESFKRFGGPIQLASNALEVLKNMDEKVYGQIMDKFTLTGDKVNGIKDGVRDEWYAKFDLASPAESRGLQYTGVIERPELQEIYLNALRPGILKNGDGVERYETNADGHGVKAIMQSGKVIEGDVIIGADGIWSAVRATLRDTPAKGEGSGVTYSGYTVFAGELNYDSFDNGEVGYKVYIGPEQYFVITDIGNKRYQWYAFLSRPAGSTEKEEKPDGQRAYLEDIFAGWSKDIFHILKATQENEIEQRDLYDLPPSVRKPWSAGPVALLGDAVHAMMPNLGQGGGQAIEDAFVIAQELETIKTRNEISSKFESYRDRRLVRSAAVQGLSRLASDIIVSTFDTPAKIEFKDGLKFENFNYNGIVTRMLQPILPLFFSVQFSFLYDGWRNERAIDLKAGLGFLLLGGLILLVGSNFALEAGLGLELGLESIFGTEGLETLLSQVRDLF